METHDDKGQGWQGHVDSMVLRSATMCYAVLRQAMILLQRATPCYTNDVIRHYGHVCKSENIFITGTK